MYISSSVENPIDVPEASRELLAQRFHKKRKNTEARKQPPLAA